MVVEEEIREVVRDLGPNEVVDGEAVEAEVTIRRVEVVADILNPEVPAEVVGVRVERVEWD